MGVKLLSSFIDKSCKNSYYNCHISILKNKTIAVDTSLYLHKFKEMGDMIERLYLMCSIFRHYNINPIFVFDGNPPSEKIEFIQQKNKSKTKLKLELDSLQKLDSTKLIQEKINKLKKQLVYLTNKDIEHAKTLIKSMGFKLVIASNESDPILACLTYKNITWGSMSDDSDMFALNCPIVIKYFNLHKFRNNNNFCYWYT